MKVKRCENVITLLFILYCFWTADIKLELLYDNSGVTNWTEQLIYITFDIFIEVI